MPYIVGRTFNGLDPQWFTSRNSLVMAPLDDTGQATISIAAGYTTVALPSPGADKTPVFTDYWHTTETVLP